MKTGIELIQEERNRQITSENYTSEHDDTHNAGELALAASAYIIHYTLPTEKNYIEELWPWEKKYWKPSEDKVRNLVKAEALIAAEIDRLQRLDGVDCSSDSVIVSGQELKRLQNLEYGLDEDGYSLSREYDE